jgi:hypothetical protein
MHQRIRRHQPEHACDQVNAGGHHGCGMNKRGNRRWTGHRVRQPHVQRELGALAHRAAEKTNAHDGWQGPAQKCPRAGEDTGVVVVLLGEVHGGLVEVERAELEVDQHEADEEAEVAHAVGDEGLHLGVLRHALMKVITDEQVAAQADQLPEDKEE